MFDSLKPRILTTKADEALNSLNYWALDGIGRKYTQTRTTLRWHWMNTLDVTCGRNLYC